MLPSMQGKAKQPSRRGKPLFYRSEMFEARKPDGRVALHPNPGIKFLRAVIKHKEIRRTGMKAHPDTAHFALERETFSTRDPSDQANSD